MPRILRRSLFSAVALALLLTIRAQAQTASGEKAVAAEFPTYDNQLLRVQQRGDAAAAAARALAREPDAVDTLALLIAQDRIADAIAVAERIVARHPDRLLGAVKLLAHENHRFRDTARGHPEALARIARSARERLSSLPREEAARAARQVLMFERRQPSRPGGDSYGEALDDFRREYAGTEAALQSEVEKITRRRVSWEQIDELIAFARARPGTNAAARALFDAGWQLTVNIAVTGVERRGSDPTDRFMRVLAIVKELESGAYPRSEWVDRAPELVTGFFASNPVIAPANVHRLAAEYVAFARAHLGEDADNPAESALAYLLTTKLADLYKSVGDPVPHVERTLDRLAAETRRPAFLYMKVNYYLYNSINEPGQRAAMRAKAIEALRALSGSGTDLYHRKALATLGYLQFENGEYRDSLAHFTQYVQKYPASPYAWLAALRLAASQAALDDWKTAAASYRAAAATYETVAVARMLGHELAARSFEAIGDFTAAIREHEAARRGWDPEYASYSGRDLSLTRANPRQTTSAVDEPAPPMTADAIAARVAQLQASLQDPAGPLLERGRWLLQQGRRTEAADTLARLLKQHPRSRLADDARALSHHAQLETALIIANVEGTGPDPAAALAQLTRLGRDPYDGMICVAGIARATLLSRDRPDAARTAMQETLAQCRARSVQVDRGTTTPLETDAIAVRNAVFKPFGGGVYGSGGWNAFSWPTSAPPFLLVHDAIPVKTADGKETQTRFRQPYPGLDQVVFVDDEQIHLLNAVMIALGGTKRFEPASVMATPNQPAGAALDVMALWTQFFPARPGHWGGWEFEAYPRIRAIEFLDAARTRAAVPVTIGYSGATVVLEKRDGVWHAIELTDRWIT
jgi:tetratricopeptide (TPR) repeat protein